MYCRCAYKRIVRRLPVARVLAPVSTVEAVTGDTFVAERAPTKTTSTRGGLFVERRGTACFFVNNAGIG